MSTDDPIGSTKPIGSKSCDTGKLTGKQLGVATLAYRLGLTNLAALASLAGLLGWLGWLAWLAGLAGLALIQQTPSDDKEQLFLKNSHHRLQSRTMFTSKRLRLGSECVRNIVVQMRLSSFKISKLVGRGSSTLPESVEVSEYASRPCSTAYGKSNDSLN